MLPHQQRVLQEKVELDDKIMKLTAFFDTDNYKSLKKDEQQRLTKQLDIMKQYTDILSQRINAF